MAERLGEALLDLDTDDRDFNRGVERAGKKADGLGRTFDMVSKKALMLGRKLSKLNSRVPPVRIRSCPIRSPLY